MKFFYDFQNGKSDPNSTANWLGIAGIKTELTKLKAKVDDVVKDTDVSSEKTSADTKITNMDNAYGTFKTNT